VDNTTNRWILDIAAWTAGLIAITVLIADAMAGDILASAPNERWKAATNCERSIRIAR